MSSFPPPPTRYVNIGAGFEGAIRAVAPIGTDSNPVRPPTHVFLPLPPTKYTLVGEGFEGATPIVIEPTRTGADILGPPSHVRLPPAPANYTKIGQGFEGNVILPVRIADTPSVPFFPRTHFHQPQPLMDGSIWVVATGSSVFLPDATAPGIKGRAITVKNVTDSVVKITVFPKVGAGQLIDGQASLVLSTARGVTLLLSDGENWMKIV